MRAPLQGFSAHHDQLAFTGPVFCSPSLCAGQVDWAALAQAWIAQKESTGPEQPNVQPNGQDIPGLESVGPGNHGALRGDPAFGRMWQPGTFF